jgi:hypothetical protein
MKKLDWKPATLDECMKAFNEMFLPEEQIEFTKMTKDEVGSLHLGLGQWIRNNWDLWKGGALLDHLKSLGMIHPDDMSTVIMEEYWARMNGVPSTMQEDIGYYKNFWDKQGIK